MSLERYYKGHKKSYQIALNEIKNGRKETHWMWYIFPQIKGLGESDISVFYSINDINEAIEYYNDPLLKKHLIEICTELLKIDNTIINILGYPDYLKLHSCITLFLSVDSKNKILKKIIEKFYNNELDKNTLNILENQSIQKLKK